MKLPIYAGPKNGMALPSLLKCGRFCGEHSFLYQESHGEKELSDSFREERGCRKAYL